jgi:hypothetical protein
MYIIICQQLHIKEDEDGTTWASITDERLVYNTFEEAKWALEKAAEIRLRDIRDWNADICVPRMVRSQ